MRLLGISSDGRVAVASLRRPVERPTRQMASVGVTSSKDTPRLLAAATKDVEILPIAARRQHNNGAQNIILAKPVLEGLRTLTAAVDNKEETWLPLVKASRQYIPARYTSIVIEPTSYSRLICPT